LLGDLNAGSIFVDKACDSNALRAFIAKTGVEAVISFKAPRNPADTVANKLRNRIELFFNKLEQFGGSPHATTAALSTSKSDFTS
jgi:hypothetical protein